MNTHPSTAEIRVRMAAIGEVLAAATEGPWWSDDDPQTWRLHGVMFRTPSAFPGGPDQVMNKQILKAPKSGTPYAEYWPEPADAALIEGAWQMLSDLLQYLDLYVGHEPTLAEEEAHAVSEQDRLHGMEDRLRGLLTALETGMFPDQIGRRNLIGQLVDVLGDDTTTAVIA